MLNERLLIARRRRGLTQAELARAANLAQADISRTETRGWLPPLEIRQAIAAALDTTEDELFADVTAARAGTAEVAPGSHA